MRSELGGEMSLLEHLIELRKRLLLATIGLALGFGAAYFFRKELFGLLVQPLCKSFDESCQLITTQVAETFIVHFKTALLFGFFISSPWIFFQLWRFVSPGLYKKEKKYVLPFVLVASLMFVGGALLGYFYVFPFAFKFFLGSELNTYVEPSTAVGPYFSFAASLLFAFGLLFEIPVVIVFLNLLGLVAAKDLWASWRYGIVGIFALSAALTPADPMTMLMLAVPLSVLFILSLVICSALEKSRTQKIESPTP